jgi:(1->4)-alpha-D-glucan 1-alpha-D-glucosylmutase
MASARRQPVSTYRLQLRPGFGFSEASDILPYLDELGITGCYVSPILKPTSGSAHGYDICDHHRLNPELGSQTEFESWCATLRSRGIGHIVDFVPNHMACDPVSNVWWRDVLENGPSSPFAKYFDVDWDPVKPELKGKILLPLLGDQYGRVLERGELQLRFEDGALHVRYFDRALPINPRQSPRVLGAGLDDLQQRFQGQAALREYLSILTALQNLPAYTEQDADRIVERQREKEVARERLNRLTTESPEIAEHIESAVRLANGIVGDRSSFDLLHTLLEHQAYRLAYWRTASDEINYRRFFDINELVGLRMEEPEVFEAMHALLRQLIASGQVTGLRIDHPDGLFDPAQYFDRIQQMATESRPEWRSADGAKPFYIVAEKILSEGESLREDWSVAGTTGYSFLNAVAGLFIDGRNAQRLRRVYGRLTGQQSSFADVAYRSKRTILLTAMASELNVLAHALNRLSERDRRNRDFTLNTCRAVLREVIACFPVYRTYVSERGVDAFDRAVVSSAIHQAQRRNPLMEPSIFEFLKAALLTDATSTSEDSDARERLRFAMQFQQFTGPVQAKGVEDTAFYRYHVLAAANDVGGNPARLGVSPAEFLDANVTRLRLSPGELMTTATHDTKRGEDARTRIAVLSESPDIWRRAVSVWMRANGRHRTKLTSGWAPDRNDEYLFYQTLVGAWPPDPARAPIPDQAPADLVTRVNAYMQKAIREAKVKTSWINEDQAYGRAMARFVERTLTGATSLRFLRSFVPLQRRIAARGMINSLSQLVLKLGSPGVSDVYQGNELWDLSLVDPDNRRSVDFRHRHRVLHELMPLIDSVAAGRCPREELIGLFESWEDGRIKLFITACALRFRRAHPEVVRDGIYDPLLPQGPSAEHLVGFGRRHQSGELLVIVPRLLVSLVPDDSPPTGEAVWTTTRVQMPASYGARCYRHLLTGDTVLIEGGPEERWIRAADLYRHWPVAMLWAPADVATTDQRGTHEMS